MRYSKELFEYLTGQLIFDDPNEKRAVIFWLLEHFLGLSRTDVLVNKEVPTRSDAVNWQPIVERLNAHEPIQYLLGETTFFGRTFRVTPNVLIPRPETEELVQLVMVDVDAAYRNPLRVLDIGTGSGCLAVSLAAAYPYAEVFAMDISAAALEVAAHNAEINGVNVTFIGHDILDPNVNVEVDVIVSNPPYVMDKEATTMQTNVTAYEPHLALFVPDENPMLFYEAIGAYASRNLSSGGSLYLEINENLGEITLNCIKKYGFQDARLILDIHGKERFIAATQPGSEK